MPSRLAVLVGYLCLLPVAACGGDSSTDNEASTEAGESTTALEGSDGLDSATESTTTSTGDGDADSGSATTTGDGDSGGDGDTGSSSGDGDSGGDGDAGSGDGDGDGGPMPACYSYDSMEEEFAPVQTVGAGLPSGADALTWSLPTTWTYTGPFSGSAGSPASHEGIDYVHDDMGTAEVPVLAAADGTVVYIRLGCPQSQLFGFNNSLRECGSGWGNHVVIDHGGGVFTRYAHLHPVGTSVLVGDTLSRGQELGVMGNSGRSDQRHLHFELGAYDQEFDPCEPSQSMDAVHDPDGLSFE